jgi:ubiquinone/menaquinone biosynthesis C-methylase UbiE
VFAHPAIAQLKFPLCLLNVRGVTISTTSICFDSSEITSSECKALASAQANLIPKSLAKVLKTYKNTFNKKEKPGDTLMNKQKSPCPARLSFLLSNPVRRWLQPRSGLLDMISLKPSDVVMDFGCGPGFYTLEIAKRANLAIAVDISSEMLRKAQNKTAKEGVMNIRFIQSDGKTIQVENETVDVVFLVTVYHEIQDPQTVLEEFSRVLKPNGRLIVVEVVEKSLLPGAPVQAPNAIKVEIEEPSFFKHEQTLTYKKSAVFFFSKDTQE